MVQISISGQHLRELFRSILPVPLYIKLTTTYLTKQTASNILQLLYKYCQDETLGMHQVEFKVLCLYFGIKITSVNDLFKKLSYYDISTEINIPVKKVKNYCMGAKQILAQSSTFRGELNNLLENQNNGPLDEVRILNRFDLIESEKELVVV